MTAWVRRTAKTYFGNASAVRDYRSQLRGNRALLLWSVYLALLILLGGLAYSQIMDSEASQSIASLQGQLSNFYGMVIGMLAAVVSLVAPSLTASAITVERQRKSLDLIFSAPVQPRYLLVGKMIASFRYLVMLLVLALPVTAVCVVMGGATWSDVIGCYVVLLSSGLVFMAIGLAVSAQAATLIGSIVNTYILVIAYLWTTSMFGVIFAATRSFGGPMGGSTTNEAPWAVVLTPFTAWMTAPTFTLIYGFEVPNYLLGLVFALAVTKLMLSGAGSVLSPFGSPETRQFRIYGLVFTGILVFLAGLPMISTARSMATSMSSVAGSTGPTPDYMVGSSVATLCIVMFWILPTLVCHAPDAERKFWWDGLISFKAAIRGTPSGALPYILMLWGIIVGVVAGSEYIFNRSLLGFEFWGLAAWGLAFLIFWWGVGRFFSGFGMNLKSVRTSLIAAGLVLLALPLPILSMIAFNAGSTPNSDIWMLHMAYPITPSGAPYALVYAAVMTVVGVLLALASEANLRAKVLGPNAKKV